MLSEDESNEDQEDESSFSSDDESSFYTADDDESSFSADDDESSFSTTDDDENSFSADGDELEVVMELAVKAKMKLSDFLVNLRAGNVNSLKTKVLQQSDFTLEQIEGFCNIRE